MARTKQTARKSSGGKAPRKMLQCSSKTSFRQYMVSRQQVTYGSHTPAPGTGQSKQGKSSQTSYLNYENMFYSYDFYTGPPTAKRFEPRFTSGAGVNPITKETEYWVGMCLNSKFDGDGMKKYGRPHLNLVVVLDVSGSMSVSFSEDSLFQSKLDVAKHCLQSLCDQLKPSDSFGLVRFNDAATVHCDVQTWNKVNKNKLKSDISKLMAYGSTNLTAAIDCATKLFSKATESKDTTSRIIFLTDLVSTVDSVNDEKRLLASIKSNADRGIYTTVVGIGMDLNVALVEDISRTRGAKYCSVDSGDEFSRIMSKEFDYDVTILGFNIQVSLKSPKYQFVKGYGSPELSSVASGKPVVISSEFPSWKNDKGETKGGMLLFKLGTKKTKGKKQASSGDITPGDTFKVEVEFDTLEGICETQEHTVTVADRFTDTGTRKGALLVHYVDLQNDYVLNRATRGVSFLELFQSFREHFLSELEDMKDKSIATSNKGDLEMIDKIIQLENPGSNRPQAPQGSTPDQKTPSTALRCSSRKRSAPSTTRSAPPVKKEPTTIKREAPPVNRKRIVVSTKKRSAGSKAPKTEPLPPSSRNKRASAKPKTKAVPSTSRNKRASAKPKTVSGPSSSKGKRSQYKTKTGTTPTRVMPRRIAAPRRK